MLDHSCLPIGRHGHSAQSPALPPEALGFPSPGYLSSWRKAYLGCRAMPRLPVQTTCGLPALPAVLSAIGFTYTSPVAMSIRAGPLAAEVSRWCLSRRDSTHH